MTVKAQKQRSKILRPLKKAIESDQLSLRQEVIRLHQEVFRRNQRRINESVYGYSSEFLTYQDTYQQAVSDYNAQASTDELDDVVTNTNLIYFGDYHTLPQAQRSYLRMLRRLPPDRPVTLALEFVPGKHQNIINQFMADEIQESEFLESIGYEPMNMFGTWEVYSEIFKLAKERGYRALGIDTLRKGAGPGSLKRRDTYAARRIAKEHRTHPENLIVVFIGEMHVAPTHLPKIVLEELDQMPEQGPGLIIYQNAEPIYWSLQEQGLEHQTALVRISNHEYCIINTPPIVCQQSFLNWLEMDDITQSIDAVEENFKHYVEVLLKIFNLEIGDALSTIEIATVVDLSFLKRLQRRGDFSKDDMEQIKKQILSSESYYIPRANMVYLGNLSMNHASEEATHFLRHVTSGCQEPLNLVDAFYARALEEAVGFLGSKMLNHKRKCPHIPFFVKQSRSRSTSSENKALARGVIKHDKMMSGVKVRGMQQIYESGPDLFNKITHVIGYQLGDKLFYALMDGTIQMSHVRELFFEHFEEEGTALTTYLHWALQVRDVQIPERL